MSRDDLEDHITEQLKDGLEITAEDFEGRECDHCGNTIPFADWPENVVTWDIRVHDPREAEPDPLFHRYYYCSKDCKTAEQYSPTHNTEPDVIREEDLDDETLIADGGEELGQGTTRAAFDSDRDWDYSRLANWIDDNLDVTFTEADKMAEAAVSVKYGGACDDGE